MVQPVRSLINSSHKDSLLLVCDKFWHKKYAEGNVNQILTQSPCLEWEKRGVTGLQPLRCCSLLQSSHEDSWVPCFLFVASFGTTNLCRAMSTKLWHSLCVLVFNGHFPYIGKLRNERVTGLQQPFVASEFTRRQLLGSLLHLVQMWATGGGEELSKKNYNSLLNFFLLQMGDLDFSLDCSQVTRWAMSQLQSTYFS